MNIAMFIATEKGWYSLKNAMEKGYAHEIKLVVTFRETNVEKSYDDIILRLCEENDILCYYWSDIKNRLIGTIKKLQIDIAFTVSWRFLIDTEINEITKYGLVVFHDSLLPKYRGFAPTPTAIICGEKKVGVSALIASDKVDEGDIILQREIDVEDHEYISAIIKKEAIIYGDMIIEIIEMARKNTITLKKQDHSLATYSIWRDVCDCKIDWNKSSFEIRNFIRAISAPYPGAYFYYDEKKAFVIKAEVVDDLKFAIRQPGKIWQIIDNCPVVVCGTGMLKITKAKFEDGSKVTFNKLRRDLSMEMIV